MRPLRAVCRGTDVDKSRLLTRAARDREWAYRPPKHGQWDELVDGEGLLRPYWRRVAAGLRHMGYAEFDKREEAGQRLIQSNGITYNVYGDPQGKERPWLMDMLPLTISAAEWDAIERAVIQRVALLNTVLSDLYGPQRLLRDGLLPPELVFANPAYLRACCGIVPRDGVFLQNYAVDLARAPNGSLRCSRRWPRPSSRTMASTAPRRRSRSGAATATSTNTASSRPCATVASR